MIVEILYVKGARALTIHYMDKFRPLKDVRSDSVQWSDRIIPKPMDGPAVQKVEDGKSAELRAKIRGTKVGEHFDFDGHGQAARRAASSMGATVQTRKLDGCGFRVLVLSKPNDVVN